VCDELDSTVTAYAWDSGRGELKPFQVITTLPEDYVGGNTTAEIEFAPSGHYLYVSNRGHNSIVIFSVDQASGKAQSDRLGVDTRPHPAFLRSRSDRAPALRGQSRQRQHRGVHGRYRNR
jgi:6-phosphogluconolactonase